MGTLRLDMVNGTIGMVFEGGGGHQRKKERGKKGSIRQGTVSKLGSSRWGGGEEEEADKELHFVCIWHRDSVIGSG